MGPVFPQWKGFERAPQGVLLEELFDLEAEVGVVYERSIDFYKELHAHDRLMFVFPRGACVMRDRTRGPAGEFVTDSGALLVVPPRLEHEVQCLSAVFDTLLVFPSRALLAEVAREEAVAHSPLFGPGATKLRRSPWLGELVLELFSRRVVRGEAAGEAPRFLGKEITREVLRIAGLARGRRPPGDAPGEGVAERALRYIEANLFAPLRLDDIARHAHASVPTLLRHFRKKAGLTPLRYVKERRLDEARALLRRGAHSVTEVALLVGYENAGAFSEAFRTRFRRAPSQEKKRAGSR